MVLDSIDRPMEELYTKENGITDSLQIKECL